MDQQTEAELVAKVLGGEREAFATLVRRYQDYAYGTAIGMLADFDLARDVVQEAFLCAYRDLRKLKDPSRFAGWLHGIVRHTAHRALRELHRVQALAEQLSRTAPSFAVAPSPDRAAEETEVRAIVRKALARLGEKNREAVSLYYVDGLSYTDIAGFLGVTETTVRGRLQRGRAELRKELTMVAQTFKDEQLPADFSAEIQRLLDAATANAEEREASIRRLAEIGEPAVNPLCEALGDPRDPVRRAAAYALCAIGDARALRPILRALFAEGYGVANELMPSGRILAIPGVKEELLRSVRDRKPDEPHYYAMLALAHAKGDREVSQCFEQVFRDRSARERGRALWVLCEFHPERAAELIGEALRDPALARSGWPWLIAVSNGCQIAIDLCLLGFDRTVAYNSRILAGVLVLRHGRKGEAVLEDLLRTGAPDQRATAAVALADEGRPEPFDVLVNELLSGYQEREWARIVGRTLVHKYRDRLLAWAEQQKPDLTTRCALTWAVGQARIQAGQASADDILHYGPPTIRAQAVRKLAQENGPEYVPELRRLLRKGQPRKVAQEAFRQMYRLRDSAVPTVEQMLASQHWTERKAALCLLRRWDKLTAEQQSQGRQDPHVAVRHAADWHPTYAAAATWHPKWKRKIGKSDE